MTQRHDIRSELTAITALDALEQQQIEETLAWIDSGAELCRLQKPATPPRHLVSYCVVVDAGHVLLVDHRNAQLWLPTGGHVDAGEHPRVTAARELLEELGLVARHAIGAPLMVTCTTTVGLTAGHEDVSLWYVVEADRHAPVVFDQGEFVDAKWFALDEIPFDRADVNLGRFIKKLRARDLCPPVQQERLTQPVQ